jgi:uncharacterized membrane protein
MNPNVDLNQNNRNFLKAEIIDKKVLSAEENPGYYPSNDQSLNTNFIIQIDGENKKHEIYSDGLDYKVGDKIFVEKTIGNDSTEMVFLNQKIRLVEIYTSLFIFVFFIILLFGKKGVKAILSLATSILIIIYILIPLTIKGYNPVLVSSFVAMILLTSMMLITNGRNKITYSAIIGCFISIFITIILSYFTVEITSLTGKTDESWSYFNNYLNLNLNFSHLVITSMIIGVIGAVDDGAITQASVVNQLKQTNPHLSNFEYYKRAMEVGRDHAGAMINTLVLAYVASSLQVIMLIYTSTVPLYILINQEIVATEIFRSTIGSLGLLLAIPITTYVATVLINKPEKCDNHGCAHAH